MSGCIMVFTERNLETGLAPQSFGLFLLHIFLLPCKCAGEQIIYVIVLIPHVFISFYAKDSCNCEIRDHAQPDSYTANHQINTNLEMTLI